MVNCRTSKGHTRHCIWFRFSLRFSNNDRNRKTCLYEDKCQKIHLRKLANQLNSFLHYYIREELGICERDGEWFGKLLENETRGRAQL